MSQDDKAQPSQTGILMRLRGAFFVTPPRGGQTGQRGSYRRSEAGNVFFALFGAVAVVGVLGAGIMSTMRGPLTTMVEVNRAEEAKAQLRLNARLVLLDAGKNAHCGATDDDDNGGSVEYTEAIGWDAPGGNPAPSGGGLLPGSLGASITDPWGITYGYCAWDNGAGTGCANHLPGEESLNAPAIALISAGPDRQFQTSCAQAATNSKQGDDVIEVLTYTEAVAGSGGLWSIVDTGGADGEVVSVGEEIQVLGTGTSTFGGGATFGADVVTSGSVITDIITSTTADAGTIDIQADISGDAATFSETLTVTGVTTLNNRLDIAGNLAINTNMFTVDATNGNTVVAGTLSVTGATTLNNTLSVVGNNATTLGGTLDVAGDLEIGTNMFTVDATTGNTLIAGTLGVTGAATLNSTLEINSDGNTNATDALVINDSDDAEILALDDDGNLEIRGALRANGGLADPATNAGNIMVSNGTLFLSVPVSGDVTIANGGAVTITNDAVETVMILNDAVTNDKIANDAVNTDQLVNGSVTVAKIAGGAAGNNTCLRYNGTSMEWGVCGSGTGGGGAYQLDDLSDVDLTAPADQHCLVYDTSVDPDAWVNVPCSSLTTGFTDRIQDATTPTTDTYIDVDTAVANDGSADTTVFVNQGNESMRIQPDGNIGIGTSTPNLSGLLDNVLTVSSITAAGETAGIEVQGNRANDGTVGSLLFYNGVSPISGIVSDRSGADTDGNMRFYTSSGGTITERMRIHSTGRVGIGAFPPHASALLDISSTTHGFLPPRMMEIQRNAIAASVGLIIYNTDANQLQIWDGTNWIGVGTGTSGLANELVDADDDTKIEVDTAGDGSDNTTIFTNNTAESMRITADGDVGIGTNNPQAKVHVVHDQEDTTSVVVTNLDTHALAFAGFQAYSDAGRMEVGIASIAGGDYAGMHTNALNGLVFRSEHNVGSGIRFMTGPDPAPERMRITETGGVSIGTGGAPHASAMLEVTSTTRGFLPPRMTEVERDAIAAAAGLMVYNTNANQLQVWNGTTWVSAGGGGGGAIDDLSDGLKNVTQNNMFLGHEGGPNIGTNNIGNMGVGIGALDSLTQAGSAADFFGDYNVALGYNALTAVTTGASNTAVGFETGVALQGGGNNTLLGFRVMQYGSATTRDNTGVGGLALWNNTGNENVGVGALAGLSLTGGEKNTFLGHKAGGRIGASFQGSENIIIGNESAINLSTHNNNRNTIIGVSSAAGLTGGGSENILLGYNTNVTSATASRQLNIGNLIFGVLDNTATGAVNERQVGIGVTDAASISASALLEVNSTTRGFLPPRMTTTQRNNATGIAGLMLFNTTTGDMEFHDGADWRTADAGASTSDERLKKNIVPLDGSLEKLLALRTVTYNWKDEGRGTETEIGLIAQDVKKVFPELVSQDGNGYMQVDYRRLVVPLIDATKSLKDENEILKAELAEIRTAQVDILEQVHGIARHTGYGHERAALDRWMMLAMLLMMGCAVLVLSRRKPLLKQ